MNLLSPHLDDDTAGYQSPVVQTQPRGEAEPLLQQYLRILLRWRWIIIGSTIACLLAGLVITFFMTPQYTGTATIEVSRESDQVTSFQGVERDVSIADQEFYQTQYGLLRSRTLAERVATELRLVDDPAFFAMFDVESDEPAFQLANGRYPAAGRNERLRAAADTLLEQLSIDPVRMSRLVDIYFTSPDPEFSARVANAWAENFIENNLERKVESTSYGREQLQRQLAEYKQRLDESQRQLVAYASNEQIINLPAQTGSDGSAISERSIVADNLATLNEALSEATADRIAAEARYRQAGRQGASAEALANQAINSLRQRRAELAANYEQLMVRFEPEYPEARALQSQIRELDSAIAREESRISNSLEADYRAALSRESTLDARVAQLKSEFLDLRRRSIQYNIFQQEVDTNRALYDGLLQRFKEIGVAGGVGVNNVSIVDTADVPQKPSSPRLLLNILASLIVGAMLGVAIAYGMEQIDEAISDPEELQRQLGLPLLGSIPLSEAEEPKDALLDRKSELLDAYLAVQTNLSFTTERGVPRSFAVTSTRPGEGKSTTALALATTLARANRKVILIDGDMRSPSVHHLAGVSHDKGLSNYLAGAEKYEDLIFRMEDLEMDAMTAGPIPPNAAELLTGDRLSTLVEALLERYDHVVVDSPPVMGLADAPLIGSKVEGLIYVVESHGIRTSLVKAAINRLAGSRATIIGGVLTKFESRKSHFGYQYGYDYGRSEAAEA